MFWFFKGEPTPKEIYDQTLFEMDKQDIIDWKYTFSIEGFGKNFSLKFKTSWNSLFVFSWKYWFKNVSEAWKWEWLTPFAINGQIFYSRTTDQMIDLIDKRIVRWFLFKAKKDAPWLEAQIKQQKKEEEQAIEDETYRQKLAELLKLKPLDSELAKTFKKLEEIEKLSKIILDARARILEIRNES